MGGGKKSKKDKDKKSRKTGRESSSAAVSREVRLVFRQFLSSF